MEEQKIPPINTDKITQEVANIKNYLTENLGKTKDAISAGLNQQQSNKVFLNNALKGIPSMPIQDIQDLGAGNKFVGPDFGDKILTPVQRAQLAVADINEKVKSFSDPLAKSKPVSFDSSFHGANIERYYQHPKFKQFGFDVYSDNESYYTKNSTFSDDFKRMATQWGALAGGAIYDQVASWGDLASGKWNNPNIEGGRLMEERLAIAHSNRKGFGAWSTNFVANSAYTVGMLTEMAAEEALLFGVTALTGGATGELAALRTAQNVGKFGKAMSTMFKTFNKADKAKSFWSASVSGLNAAGNFINPLDNTTSFLKAATNTKKAESRLSDFAKTYKTAEAFYFDARAMNAILAESNLEGGIVSANFISNATNEWEKANPGKEMPKSELTKIYNEAQKAGVAAVYGNIPMIHVSNKIVLDGVFKGFKPIQSVVAKSGLQNKMFKAVYNSDWRKSGGNPYDVIKKGISGKVFTKDYLKSLPSTFIDSAKKAPLATGIKGLKYFQANVMEGLQEVYQEGLSATVSDYYLDKYYGELYNDPYIATQKGVLESIKKGFGEQTGSQGLDVFLSGFLMGGVIQGPLKWATNKGSLLQMRFSKDAAGQSKLETYRKQQEEEITALAKALNSVAKDTGSYISWLDENVKRQRDLSARIKQSTEDGDVYDAKKAQDESLFSHVHTLLQTGNYDIFIEHLKDLRGLSDTELNNLFPSENTSFEKPTAEKLESAIKKAESIKEDFDYKKKQFTNPFDPSLIDKKKHPDQYQEEVLLKTSFDQALMMSVFAEYSFKNALNSIESLTRKAAQNIPVSKADTWYFTSLYEANTRNELLRSLKNEIDSLEVGTPEQKKEANRKRTIYGNLMELVEAMQQFQEIDDIITRSHNNVEARKELQAYMKELGIDDTKVLDENGQYNMFGVSDEEYDTKVKALMIEKLRDKYMRYTKNIAALKNVFPIESMVDNSLQDLMDFLKLSNDAQAQAQYINILADPGMLLNVAKRVDSARKKYNGNIEAISKKALKKFVENNKTNQLLSDIGKLGVFFPESQVELFERERVFPRTLINEKGEVLKTSDPLFAKVLELFEAWEQLTGVTLKNKPKITSEGTVETPETKPKDSTASDVPAMDKGLQEMLVSLHKDAVEKDGAIEDFDLWVKESPVALAAINEYNQSAQTAATAVKTEETEEVPKTEINLEQLEDEETEDGPKPITRDPLLEPLNSKTLNTAPGGRFYHEVDDKGKRIEGTPAYHRVSKFKIGASAEESIDNFFTRRGNIIDDLLRFVLKQSYEVRSPIEVIRDTSADDNAILSLLVPQLQRKFEESLKDRKYTDIEVSELFMEQFGQIINTLAKTLEGYTIHSELNTLWGEINGYKTAGTLDLLVEKDGVYSIIDIKTSSKNRYNDYLSKDSDHKLDDMVQLNIYAELLKQRTGIEVSEMKILPLQISEKVSDKGGSLLKITTGIQDGKVKFLTVPKMSVEQMEELRPARAEQEDYVEPREPQIKRQVPENFKGKLIYSLPLTVHPSIYIDYDVVNADDIIKDILLALGEDVANLSPLEIGSKIYKLKAEDKEAIHKLVLEQIRELTANGKTVISSNTFLKHSADIIVAPNESFMMGTPEEIARVKNSKEAYLAVITAAEEYQRSGKKGDVEYFTLPLEKLFNNALKYSTEANDITLAKSMKELRARATVYATLLNKGEDSIHYFENVDGVKQPLDKNQMIDLILTRMEQLKNEDNIADYNIIAGILNSLTTESKLSDTDVQSVVDASSQTLEGQALKDLAAAQLDKSSNPENTDSIKKDFFDNLKPEC